MKETPREPAPGEAEAVDEGAAAPDPSGEADAADLLLEMVAAAPGERPEAKPRPGEVTVGVLVGFAASGEPLVDHPENPSGAPLPARFTVPLDPSDIGREAALLFEGGDPGKPILLGLLRVPAPVVPKAEPARVEAVEVRRDGESIVLSAEREIVLSCGKASITLTRAGKILIRGAYVLTRSAGVNRIQGGSVQIN
jgi:Domain of unknown function (DUF6484)